MKRIFTKPKKVFDKFMDFETSANQESRYAKLQRNIIVLMVLATVVPLTIMAYINHYQFSSGLKAEMIKPLQAITNKTARSFELFLEERSASMNFIASVYTPEQLSNQKILNHIFQTFRKEYCCYIDIGVIDHSGKQVNYIGPYDLLNKDYSKQDWFKEVMVKGIYVSDVFLGYRKFPHIAIAVMRMSENGKPLILRATMDTSNFKNFISGMSLDQYSDAFLINDKGIMQTTSRFYGNELEPSQLQVPQKTFETAVVEMTDKRGNNLFVAYASFAHHDYTLVAVKPYDKLFGSWFALQVEMLMVYLISIIVIVYIVIRFASMLVKQVKASDDKRQRAFHELEHNQKLSSIGRLSAGVAHEINNPLAVINENAGLMKDLILFQQDDKNIFLEKLEIVMNSVDRAKRITHRLLGFARRIEIRFEQLNINEIIKESIAFIEKEMQYRNVELKLDLDDELPNISSDKGQLEQVILNIATNALVAVEDGGLISFTSQKEEEFIKVKIIDDGHGIPSESLLRIFEPFFTTKKDKGTGLGLSISYGIIKKLGGDIQVESIEGQGSTFIISLPIENEEGLKHEV